MSATSGQGDFPGTARARTEHTAQARKYCTAHFFPTRVFPSRTQAAEGLEGWAEFSKWWSPSLHSRRQRCSECGSERQQDGFLVCWADLSPTHTYLVRNSGCGPARCGCTSPRCLWCVLQFVSPRTRAVTTWLQHCWWLSVEFRPSVYSYVQEKLQNKSGWHVLRT